MVDATYTKSRCDLDGSRVDLSAEGPTQLAHCQKGHAWKHMFEGGWVAKAISKPLSRLLDEHIEMLGFPQIIVTRAFAFAWLANNGWAKHARGLTNLNLAAFGGATSNQPLTGASARNLAMDRAPQDN